MTGLEHYYIQKSKDKLGLLKMSRKKRKSGSGFQIFFCKERGKRQKLQKIELFDLGIEAETNL